MLRRRRACVSDVLRGCYAETAAVEFSLNPAVLRPALSPRKNYPSQCDVKLHEFVKKM